MFEKDAYLPQYRVGVIGCGSIASTTEDEVRKVPGYMLLPCSHATMYRAHPRTRIVAATDIDPARVRAFCERWNVSGVYTDYREMLVTEHLDIVSIAANTPVHFEMTIEAARSGVKGIFLEKPIAQTLAEADEMIRVCQITNAAVVVNHYRTFDPYYRAVRAAIDAGEIGELQGVVALWHQGVAQGGCHLFDLLRYTLSAKPAWVFFHKDDDPKLPDPGGDAYLAYQNGVRVHVHMPFRSVAPAEVEFVGTKGAIRIGSFEGSRHIWQFVDVLGRTVPLESPFPVRLERKSGMYVALEELIAAIEQGTEPASSLRTGREVLEITVALLKSGQEKTAVSLPIDDLNFEARSWL